VTDSPPERRSAAILAADVAGYSRLMQAAEEATLAAVQAHQRELVDPAVASHGGRIVKTTGDGFLAEFASAPQALRCALAIRNGMAARNATVLPSLGIAWRIGIHVGDVISAGADIFGHSVNVAARLQALAEPGGICLSDAACRDVRGDMNVELRDGGRRHVKNFATPLHVHHVVMANAPPAYPPPVVDRPSIAILPFETLSRHRRLEFMADGLVEDLTALMARMPGFFVIARASAFAYKGRAVDIRTVARELGVRYVVTGSCRGCRDRVRVTTQLTDAETGEHLWDGRFDAPFSDAFDIQEDIARAIVSELEPELNRAELTSIQRQRPDNPDAWDCYRQALGAMAFGGWTEDTVAAAVAHLRRAITLDPQFGLAHAYYALLLAMGQQLGVVPADEAHRADAMTAAEQALALDAGNSEALGYVACALSDLGERRRAEDVVQRALEIDPSNAQARVVMGAIEAFEGDCDNGIVNMRLGMRLSPRDRRLGFWAGLLALFLLLAGRTGEALAEARTACRYDGAFFLSPLVESIALLRLGRDDHARAALQEALRIRPNLSTDQITRLCGAEAAALLEPLLRQHTRAAA
jgi:adenylate cyclase